MEERILRERLAELRENDEYHNDFNKLKREILSKSKIKRGFLIKWHIPEDWDGDLNKVSQKIPFRQFKNILSTENVNDWWVLIPTSYFPFKERWDVEYFFDPTKRSPNNFQPFKRKHPVIPCFPPMSEREFDALPEGNFEPYKLHLEVDINFPIKEILREVRKEIKEWKDDLSLKVKSPRGRPKSKYSRLILMKEIFKNQCAGHRLGAHRESEILHRTLIPILGDKETPSVSTIMRHHLPAIRKTTRIKD